MALVELKFSVKVDFLNFIKKTSRLIQLNVKFDEGHFLSRASHFGRMIKTTTALLII